jgi:bacterioferritin
MKRIASNAAYVVLLAVTFGVAAEATARLDDWINSGIPFLARPTTHEDLTFHEGVVIRGAPGAVHKKWKMNQHGFRGPEISERPGQGVTRVIVLGASETFGLYESRDMEFPAVLRRLLETEGAFEVINAALPGMTVRSMKPYWDAWVARFAPHVVIIYPSPLFYLNMGAPPRASSAKEPVRQASGEDHALQLRIMDRIFMLDGLPNLQDLAKLNVGEDVPEILDCDLKAETGAQATIKAGIAHCESVRDYVSRDLLQEILDDTEEHIDFLETQIDLIGKVGLQNYLQSQMGEIE